MKTAVAVVWFLNVMTMETLGFGGISLTTTRKAAVPKLLLTTTTTPSFGGFYHPYHRSSVRQYAVLDIKSDLKDIEEDFEKRVRFESLIWFFPIGMSASAFLLQRPTSLAFHQLYTLLIGSNVGGGGGGSDKALEMITPALNGPVSTSISILFGTLVAITISSLYARQDVLHKSLINMGEELHHGSLLIQGLPPIYCQQAKQYLDEFSHRLCRAFLTGDYHILADRDHGLNNMVLFLNTLSQKQAQQQGRSKDDDGDATMILSSTVISQLYDSVNRVLAERAKLVATFRTTFPVWHYLNLTMLATAICTIFLMEIDHAVQLYLDAFEIRTCWAILVGAFSMLGMVCYDLTTPYSGIFRILSSKDVEREFIENG